MRYLFALWAAPLVLFWGWFFLSLNDINFGYIMLSRQLHDLVFQLYGQMLGIDPAIIPGMVAKACVFDSLLLMAIWAFRRRRTIAGWIGAMRGRLFPSPIHVQGSKPVENALQDERGRGRIDLPGSFAPRKIHFDQSPFGRHGR